MTRRLVGNGAGCRLRRLALAAASVSVAGLAACSHAPVQSTAAAPRVRSSALADSPTGRLPPAPAGSRAGPSTTPAGSRTVTHSLALVGCKQRYDSWKQGQGNGLVSAVSAVGSADSSGDNQLLTAALKRAEPAVARAARYPLPSCADPKGYWAVLLMHVNAAAASTGSASSLKAAMDGVPAITRDLLTELKRVDG